MKKTLFALLLICSTMVASALPLTISGTQTKPTCTGDCDAMISLVVTGGTAPYTYAWDNGATTATITGLCADTFRVVVTDAMGATATQTRIIRDPYPIRMTFSTVNISCFGACDGSVTTIPTGGTGAYSYAWSNGGTTATINNLCPGTYVVTVTDANGCSYSCGCPKGVKEPTQLLTGISKVNATCSGNCDGSALATASGGTTPYTFNWNNGATSAAINALCAGSYTATITDANGCSALQNATITDNAALIPSCMVIANESYPGAADGSLTASANGGVQPYSYVWSNGATTAQINGLSAGSYTVTITDDAGCSATTSCVITAPTNCGGFRTQTQGGWGQCQQNGNNPGTYLANNFAAAFPNGLTVGCTNTLKLTSSNAVCTFLPSGSTPRKLNLNFVDPTNYNNVLAGQIVALTLNVRFDAYDGGFGSSATLLGNQVIVSGTFAGWTVNQFLDTANKVLGGCPSQYSPSAINSAASSINQNYVDGTSDNGFLACPGSVNRIASKTGIAAEVFPNPFNSQVTVRIPEDRSATIILMDMSGKVMQQFLSKGGEISIAEELKPGAYLLNIEYNDGQHEVVKILKTN